ncbi:beta-mannosidase [Mycobacterium sp. TNTM28]|uniref:Beta-mannosidase n=1 Tax=[Mycobacterium] fortunisiensis TaxID=2600579 RepID=A0ABS6KQA4_9MYCO|nr:beta-mannosidase [[Mycobacterium] fortunisiensis]MBU9765653.1 beta-mannosidase [[Mycobacterium] fortunisiensis]
MGGRAVRTAALLCVAVLIAACSPPPPVPAPATATAAPTERAPAPQLGVSGTSLTLDGKPWWPIGINAYQLGTDWDINTGCGAQVDPEQFFSLLPPRSLIRVNVNSTLAVNKSTGALDFAAIDAVFDAAARHDQLLIAVLTTNEGGCENEHFKDHAWFSGGWRTDRSHGHPMTYADWLDTAVTRWADSPALAGWSAVGEPEPSNCGVENCDWPSRQCYSDSAAVLRAFFDATGARIRALDPGAVIFSGHAGGGQCGSAGDDFETVGASPGIDVLEYHYYVGTDTLPGDSSFGLQRRLGQARALGKPLLVAELGMKAGSCVSLAQRRRVLGELIGQMRGDGAAGAMFWAFVPDPRPAECTLDIGPTDPLFSMVGKDLRG